MGGKADNTGSGDTSPSGSSLFGAAGLKALGAGIQQASQNYLKQQADNGDPNAAGIAQGAQAIGAGLGVKQPVDMTSQVNMPSVINPPTPAPNLFTPAPAISPVANIIKSYPSGAPQLAPPPPTGRLFS